MKKLLFGFVSFCAVMALFSCKEEEPIAAPKLNATAETTVVAQSGGAVNIELTATRAWTAEVKGNSIDGVTVNPSSGTGSNSAITVVVNVPANEGSNRTISVVFTAASVADPVTINISQEGAKGTMMSIAEVLTAAKDTEVETEGIVAAANVNSFVMTDGKDNLVVYSGDDATTNGGVTIGDNVNVKGKVGAYDQMPQIIEPTVTKISSGNTVERGTVLEITADNIADMDITRTSYIKMTGVYSTSGKYHNLTIVGTTIQGSIAYPDATISAELAELVGHTVTLTGYFGGGAGTSNNNMFRNIIVFDVEDVSAPEYKPVSLSGFYDEAVNTQLEISGTVMALNTQGFVVGDSQGNAVYVHQNTTPEVKIGNTVKVQGKLADYYNFLQLASPIIEVTSASTDAPVYPTPTDINSTIDSWSGVKAEYVTVTGTLASGRYITISGATYQGMLNYALEDYSGYNGSVITAVGYSMSVNTTSKNLAIMVVSVEGQPYLRANSATVPATATEATIEVSSNVEWSFTYSGDWITSATKEGDAIKITFPANVTADIRTATFTLTADGVENVEVTLTQKAASAGASYTALFGPDYNSKNVGSYTDSWSATNDGFTVNLVNWNNNNGGWTHIRCGRSAAASTATITTATAIPEAIKSVTVTVEYLSAQDKLNSHKLEVATDAEFSNIVATASPELATGDVVYVVDTPTANCYYRLTYDWNSTGSNGNFRVNKVVFE